MVTKEVEGLAPCLKVSMTRAQMRKLDRELSEYLDEMVAGMGRIERR